MYLPPGVSYVLHFSFNLLTPVSLFMIQSRTCAETVSSYQFHTEFHRSLRHIRASTVGQSAEHRPFAQLDKGKRIIASR